MQTALDIAGFVGPVGPLADAANAGISLLRGDYVGAGVNAVAILPVVGDAFKAGKMVAKGADKIGDTVGVAKAKPLQNHHFATIYGQNAKDLQKEINKYGLKLDGDWNKEILPHLGRHTQEYHDEVLRLTRQAAAEAGNDVNKFLELYETNVQELGKTESGCNVQNTITSKNELTNSKAKHEQT